MGRSGGDGRDLQRRLLGSQATALVPGPLGAWLPGAQGQPRSAPSLD